MPPPGLRHGPLSPRTVHLCIDMQNVFAEATEWQTPWLRRVLPSALALARHHPSRTIFTRFIPPARPEEARGVWQRYFERWKTFTRSRIEPRLLELVPDLAVLVPPATVLDKAVYSPFHTPELAALLRKWGADTLVVSGAETDVCVGAAVFDAMDHGFRVVLARDAVCGSADETHDALMKVYTDRFSEQVELADAPTILAAWRQPAVPGGGGAGGPPRFARTGPGRVPPSGSRR